MYLYVNKTETAKLAINDIYIIKHCRNHHKAKVQTGRVSVVVVVVCVRVGSVTARHQPVGRKKTRSQMNLTLYYLKKNGALLLLLRL